MPTEADRETYIGLEHLDSGSLTVTRWGSDVDIKGQKLVMHKGDILFGRRNTYLKRAAIAPHDGLFSAHGMIWRPKEDVVDAGFFPFFVSSDYFMDEAIRISVGSLSPTINWRDLKELEFDLPDIDTQRKLSTLLWSMERTKTAYKNLIVKTDELVKSQFVEMFGDVVENTKQWPIHRLEEIATSRLGKMLDAKKQTGLYSFPYLANTNVQWFRFDLCDLRQMDFPPEDQVEFELQKGDLMVCEGGEVGRCAVWHNEITPCYFQKAIHRVRCNKDIILPEYLAFWFRCRSEYNAFEDVVGSITTIAHLPGVKLKNLNVVVPPVELQKQFVSIMEQTDKSKFAARQALADLTATQKALMRQHLG